MSDGAHHKNRSIYLPLDNEQIPERAMSAPAPPRTSLDILSDMPVRYILYYAFFVLFCATVVIIFSVYYTGKERYIYFWDYAIYWNYFAELGSRICSGQLRNVIQALVSVAYSIRENDYNLLAVLPIVPVTCNFGCGRLTYIASLAGFFLLPTSFLASRVATLSTSNNTTLHQTQTYFVATLCFIAMHPVWVPIFEGRPDILGLLVAFLVLWMLARNRIEHCSPYILIGIGILLATMFFVRRWYLYWVIGLFPGAFVADLSVTGSTDKWTRISRLARSLFVIGLTLTLLIWIIATPLMLRILSTNYSFAYSAYKHSTDVLQAFKRAVNYFGAPMLLAAAAGIFLGLVKLHTRRMAVFLTVQGIVIVILFYRVQDFTPHHLYLLLPVIYIGLMFLILCPFYGNSSAAVRIITAFIGLFFLMVSSGAVFLDSVNARIPNDLRGLFPKQHWFPKVREDINQINNLISDMDKLYRQDSGHFYVIASSTTINDDILRSACREMALHSLKCADIDGTVSVDRRDGFPRGAFVKYIVLATPTQYHLRPKDQQVIGILAREFEFGRGVARYYRRVGSAVFLEKNVRVKIFRQITPVPEEEIDTLFEEFRALSDR